MQVIHYTGAPTKRGEGEVEIQRMFCWLCCVPWWWVGGLHLPRGAHFPNLLKSTVKTLSTQTQRHLCMWSFGYHPGPSPGDADSTHLLPSFFYQNKL